MKPKDQLIYLLEHYYKNNYTTDVFVEEFYRIYNFEVKTSELSEKEEKILVELEVMVSRFSPFEEDLKIPHAYFSEEDVRKKAHEVYLKLFKD